MAKGKNDNDEGKKPDTAKHSNKSSTSDKPPTTSHVDNNMYKVLRLPNGIRVLLISQNDSSFPWWHHRSPTPCGIQQKTLEISQPSLSFVQNDKAPYGRDTIFSNLPVPSTRPMKTDFVNVDYGMGPEKKDYFSFPTPPNSEEEPNTKTRRSRRGPRKPNPNVEYTSCSVTINVGFAEDPAAHNGLAHFLEHMVHYGSKEYPDEDAYFRWMMENAIEMNAFTQTDTTTYMFECYTSVVKTSLDMLSSMLANPLLLEGCVEREIHSVDDEFMLSFEHNPLWQCFQVVSDSAKKNHPLNSFGCGNLNTLTNGQKNVKSLTNSLKKFHEEHYVGSRMTVVLQSNLSLDKLEELVSVFNKIKKGSGNIRRDTKVEKRLLDPFDTDDFRKVNFIRNSTALNLMSIIWPHRPEAWQDFKNRPLEFMSHLLRQEWQGGMLDVLRKSGLVLDIELGCPDRRQTEYTSLFIMYLVLTETGKELKNIKQILLIIFQGLESIRKLSLVDKKNLWNEFYLTHKREFEFTGPGSGLDFAVSCSQAMQDKTEEEIFTNESLPAAVFDNDTFERTLANFTPKNMNVSFSCQQYPQSVSGVMKDKRKETYTGFVYKRCSLKDLSQNTDFVKGLSNCKPLIIRMKSDRNKFVTKEDPSQPSIIEPYRDQEFITGSVEDESFSAHHFGHPGNEIYKSIAEICFVSPYCNVNERSRKLLALLTTSIRNNEAVRSARSEMARAGVRTSIHQVNNFGIGFFLEGFSRSLIKAVKILLRNAFWAWANIDEKSFNISKESILVSQKEFLGSPRRMTSALLAELLVKEKYSAEEGLEVLETVKYSDLIDFSTLLRDSLVKTEVAGVGNISHLEFDEIINTVLDLNIVPRLGKGSSLMVNPLILSLPVGNRCVRMKSKCRYCVNTAVTNFYSFHKGRFQPEVIRFTARLMRGACFWYLRTYKQLGYSVSSNYIQKPYKDPMIAITVTGPSTKHSACELDESIDSFLNLFYEMCLEQLTEADVHELKANWGFSDDFTDTHVQNWYKTQVVPNFKRNEDSTCNWTGETYARKLSIQILGSDDERCKGHKKCDKSKGFENPREEAKPRKFFSFASDIKEDAKYFICNIKAYKKDLFD